MPLMTIITTLVSLLKSSKHLLSVLLDTCRKVLCFVWKSKLIAVIVLLLYIATTQKNDISALKVMVNTEQGKYALLQQQHTNQLLSIVAQSKQTEIDRLNKEKEIEVRHNEQIHKMHTDSVALNATYNSLSDTLTRATNNLQTTSDHQAKAYGSTITELFRDCTAEYKSMATSSQQHRVAEEVAVNKYNALGDSE